jgi:type IV pilus assembly protein PilW
MTPNNITRYRQTGATLVELMVGITIGLLLALAASASFLYSKQTYTTASETARIEENGRFAINTVARYLQSAGFVMLDAAAALPSGPLEGKLLGCDFGYTNISPSSPDFTCRGTPGSGFSSAAIRVIAETDPYASSDGVFQGFDCVGDSAIEFPNATGSTKTWVATSNFFVSATGIQTSRGNTTTVGQLYCMSDRTSAAGTVSYQLQPIVPGIEQLAITYLVPSLSADNAGHLAYTAKQLTDGALWAKVVATEICVLAKSSERSTQDTGITYRDCNNVAITNNDRYSYRTFRTVVNLRNRVL